MEKSINESCPIDHKKICYQGRDIIEFSADMLEKARQYGPSGLGSIIVGGKSVFDDQLWWEADCDQLEYRISMARDFDCGGWAADEGKMRTWGQLLSELGKHALHVHERYIVRAHWIPSSLIPEQ